MQKLLFSAATAALFAGGAAVAQDASQYNGWYVVGEVGYENIDPGGVSEGSFIYGGSVGYNFRLSETIFIGLEADVRGSSSDLVDVGYGATLNVGFLVDDKTALFARSGYREVDFTGGFSGGDYTFGVGAQFGFTNNLSIRGIVDTIGFDSVEVRGGIVLDF